MGLGDFVSVAVHGQTMVAARGDRVVISKDAGQNWWPLGVPTMLTRTYKVLFSQDGTLWLAGREGVYFTRDLGKTWLWLERLPLRDVNDIVYDEARGRIVTTSRLGDGVYALDPKTMKWKFARTGYPIALIRIAGERLVAASTDDGVLLEPEGSEILTAEK
jgi:outer membrane protein assembly factor BamB